MAPILMPSGRLRWGVLEAPQTGGGENRCQRGCGLLERTEQDLQSKGDSMALRSFQSEGPLG